MKKLKRWVRSERWIVYAYCLLCFLNCTSLDDVNSRLNNLENDVADLQSALDALQHAYNSGKIIKSVNPITEENGGWFIEFSDYSYIRIMNGSNGKDGDSGRDGVDGKDGRDGVDGKDGRDGIDGINGTDGQDGLTPYLLVDQDGYWCVSYDNGEHFTRIMDYQGNYVLAHGDKGDQGEKGDKGDQGEQGEQGEKGDKGDQGDDGISVRIVVNDDGFYVFEFYKASSPNDVIGTILTPYSANPANLISEIIEDDQTHAITLVMQNGDRYTFKMEYRTPASIAILTNKVMIGSGSTATFEFRVNPSNATFNYDVSSSNCEIELDCLGATRDFNSYVSHTEKYKLSKVEQVYDATGDLKKGQYRAYITDQNQSQSYDDLVALVLTVTNENGDRVQISSSAVEVIYSGNLLLEFKFLRSGNASVLEDVEATIDGNNITLSTPFILDRSSLVSTYKTNGSRVFVGDKEQMSGISVNDFNSPVKYTVLSPEGEKNIYTVTVNVSGLPVVYINTAGSATISSKTDWMKKTFIRIVNTDGSVDYEDSKMQIRGRGNSTWSYPKKPYALKLDSKAKILGMPKHKRWVLLANWMDRTLLRNDVSFQIAKQTGMAWTPRGQFVEVVLNGKHVGNYYLCEQIKIDENRVDIQEMEASDISGDNVTGGYLMELDVYFDEVNKFRSVHRNLPYMFKYPDEDVLQPAQLSYFEKYVNDMEAAMYADDWLLYRKYADYMDVESFADWWFVYELVKNGEPNHPKSCYMHKDRLGKLIAGPVWDFDWGTFTPGTGYTVKGAIYYNRLFDDPAFVGIVKSRWNILKPQFEAVSDYIRTTALKTANSNDINIRLWPISLTVNGDEKLKYDDAIERMVAAYEEKLAWLDAQITAM